MYAPTSTNSPRSDPTSDDGEHGDSGLTEFDGAADILCRDVVRIYTAEGIEVSPLPTPR